MTPGGSMHQSAARSFIEKIIDFGLVRPADPAEKTEISAAVRAELAAIDAPPKVVVFDDLADLILADPVHDADEQVGWPAIIPGDV
jgi:hypothetical protein